MFCLDKKQTTFPPDSDAVIQLGQLGGRVAPGGLAAGQRPFPKEGSNHPSALCSKDDSASSPGEVLAAASQGRFPAPQTHLGTPLCPGIPAVNWTPERVGALRSELSGTVKVDSFESKRVKTAKPQHRLKSKQGSAGHRRVSQGFSNLKAHANHLEILLTVLCCSRCGVRPPPPDSTSQQAPW